MVTGQRSQHLHRCNEAYLGSRKRQRYRREQPAEARKHIGPTAVFQPSPGLGQSPESRKTKPRTGKTRRSAHTRETGFWCGLGTAVFSVFLAIYRIKTCRPCRPRRAHRAPRSIVSCAIPQLRTCRATRSIQQTPCERAHVKPPLYRTRPNKLGLSQNKKTNYQNKLATN